VPIVTGPGTLYTTTTGTTNNTSGTWQAWNQDWTLVGTTGSYVTSTTTTWIQWNTNYDTTIYGGNFTAETAEQRAEREARYQWQYEEQQREREAAKAKAEELLVALLSDEQALTWREHDWFAVRGSRTRRTYRVRRGIAGNVDRMAGDQAETTYCAHPPGVPAEDVCLAQLLLLATDEDAFLRVANATPRHLRVVPPVTEEAALQAA
jgi:hypothetical protein